eukprot:2969904-Pleurochrysis_carterae.AAC.1
MEFDELCRYMTERYLSKYVSSIRASSCESFSGFAEAHEVTEVFTKLVIAIKRYLQPGTSAAAGASSLTRPPARRPGLRSNMTLNAIVTALMPLLSRWSLRMSRSMSP